MRSYCLLAVVAMMFSCTSGDGFQVTDEMASPVMISPAIQAFTPCRPVENPEEVLKSIEMAREGSSEEKILDEKPQHIQVGYTKESATHLFSSMKDCEAYLDTLRMKDWQQK